MALTYIDYLKIDPLLDLQELKSSPEQHDEMLFIIIHQTYELWFKQMLHEFGLLREQLHKGETWGAVKTMRRILTILKIAVSQTDILETMTPLSFNSFRKFLDTASGFQSAQFRELEILCGLHNARNFKLHLQGTKAYASLEKRMTEANLWESFCAYLQVKGHNVPSPVRIERDGLIFDPSDTLQEALVHLLQHDKEAELLSELFIDFDEGMQEWRYRHVKMVERTIGNKIGTGGSDGVKYLRNTLHQPVFPDLWAIRSRF